MVLDKQLAVQSNNITRLMMDTKDQNQCGRTRDIIFFIPHILPCLTLMTKLPTMHFDHLYLRWRFRFCYAISSSSSPKLLATRRDEEQPK